MINKYIVTVAHLEECSSSNGTSDLEGSAVYLEHLYLLTTTDITTVEMMIVMTIAMVMMEVETAMTMGLAVEPLGCGGVVGRVTEDIIVSEE